MMETLVFVGAMKFAKYLLLTQIVVNSAKKLRKGESK
jgi:hypothetical protein